MSDLLFGEERRPEYLGPQELRSSYGAAKGINLPGTQGLQTDIRSLLGTVGGGTLGTASKDYMTSMLAGGGLNPYESQAFKNFETASLEGTKRRIGALSSTLGASGALRGSGAERRVSDLISQSMEQPLAQMGFQAQQAGLGRQAQIGMFAPQMELQQQGMGLQGLGMLGGLQQQDIANQFTQTGLMGQLANAMGQYYGVPQRQGGLMDVFTGIAGAAAPAAGSLFGIPTAPGWLTQPQGSK